MTSRDNTAQSNETHEALETWAREWCVTKHTDILRLFVTDARILRRMETEGCSTLLSTMFRHASRELGMRDSSTRGESADSHQAMTRNFLRESS